MKLTARSASVLLPLLLTASAFAGPAPEFKNGKKIEPLVEPEAARYLNDFDLSTSYVFGSDIEDEPGFGEQDASHVYVRYGRRFALDGVPLPKLRDDGFWALKLGAAYDRFDFGSTSGPLPTTLQSVAGVISLEFKVGCNTGFLLETRPGVYFSDEIGSGAFDSPTDIGFPIAFGNLKDAQGEDRFFLIVGASFSLLRSYPVIPVVGIHWRISDQWELRAYLPEPRLVYTVPSGRVQFFVGGELTGGAFKTSIENAKLSRLNDAVVTYSEYRAGGGITFKPLSKWDCVDIDLAGGWAFEREFDYNRADKKYTAEGAPYVKLEIKAQF